MSKKIKKYVLITPTYNEVENIEKTINVVLNSFPKDITKDFQVLVIDGNSPDGTADVVRKLIKIHPNVHLLMEKEKKGLGAAYLQAMSYCFDEMGSDYVIQFDADLSHDPEIIKQMVLLTDSKAEFVTGTRYKKGGGVPAEWALHRKFLSIFANLFTRIIFYPINVSDWTSGYSLLSKNVFKAVYKKVSLERGYNFQISLKKTAASNGFKIEEVPYKFRDRQKGVSKLGPDYIFTAFYFILKTKFKEIIKSSFFKVCLVGGTGFLVQTIFFLLFFEKIGIRSDFAQALSAQIAILSNYTLNNNFSFKHSKIKGINTQIKAFFKFNLISLVSVAIQFLTHYVGLTFFGDGRSTVYTFYVLGVLLGLISNFYFYKTLIWKVK